MNNVIQKIRLTSDSAQGNLADPSSIGTDVIVQFGDEDQYIATFYSIPGLEQMVAFHKGSGEAGSKNYYRIFNAVLVNDLKQSDLLPVIENMVAEGDFQLVFRRV